MNQEQQELQKLLSDFLEQHGLDLRVYALLAPKGGTVAIENFVPAGWLPVVIVEKKEVKNGSSH